MLINVITAYLCISFVAYVIAKNCKRSGKVTESMDVICSLIAPIIILKKIWGWVKK
jgi:hypothetical protein